MASLSLPFSLECPSSTSDLKINGGLCLCAVSQNGGLAGLAVPYEATSCLSDHLAIRGLLRRDELITQGPLRVRSSPKVWTYSFLCLSPCSKSTLNLLYPIPFSSWFMSSSLFHFVHLPLLPFLFSSPLLILRLSRYTLRQFIQSLAQGHLHDSC